MRLLVCISWNWKDKTRLETELDKLNLSKDTIVIPAGDYGSDQMTVDYAKARGFQVEEYNLDWTKHGRLAIRFRSSQLIKTKIDKVIVFTKEKTKGTQNIITNALCEKIPDITVVHSTYTTRIVNK